MSADPIVIVSVARTPIGGFLGALSGMSAPQLGGVAIRETVKRSGIDPQLIDELIMGCVLPAGLGQAPARQAALNAELPLSVGCTTVNKVCGSGMKAMLLAHDLLKTESTQVMIAGGMESMSNAPYLLPKARQGYRLGHGQMIDHMFFDGLEDAYFDRGRLMGTFAEDCAESYGFTRQEQDAFAIRSTERAQRAIAEGRFAWETVPVTVADRQGEVLIIDDEQPPKVNISKIPTLKPAFRKEGTVTAGNSSSISDGAAALMLMRRSVAEKLGMTPIATILGHSNYAGEPKLFPTAPVGAMRALLDRFDWTTESVDVFEINEAFAVVTMAAIRDLKLDEAKVNVHGGACAMGHPIGASGARIVISLLGALRATGGRRGVASLCIGGGEATAVAVELC